MIPLIAPSRRSLAKSLYYIPRSRPSARQFSKSQPHYRWPVLFPVGGSQAFHPFPIVDLKKSASLPLEVGSSQSTPDYLSIGEPKVHALKGFSPYRPQQKVFEAVTTKASTPGVIAVPDASAHLASFHASSSSLQASFASAEPRMSRPCTVPLAQEAFYVLDLSRVRDKYALWRECFPTVMPHYAVKANPNPAILSLMANDLKMNFDCASLAEIEAVLSLGVDPARIIFANPCKSLAHIAYARRMGVTRTTFDNEAELHKFRAVYPQAELVLRIWVDDKEAQCQLSNKYGARINEAMDLLAIAKKLSLDVVGVSFHAGSGAKAHSFKSALADAHLVMSEGKRLGFDMKLLDIGGGFPGTDEESKECASLAAIANIVRPILERDFKGVELIAEPGRFFCAEAQTLATQIIGKRLRDDRTEYTVNEGLYQSFNCMLYDHSVLLEEPARSEELGEKQKSMLFGQTCDGLDTISKEILLPELRVGDWLVVPNMGAYTNGASSKFNGFELNQTIIVE